MYKTLVSYSYIGRQVSGGFDVYQGFGSMINPWAPEKMSHEAFDQLVVDATAHCKNDHGFATASVAILNIQKLEWVDE